MSFLTAEWRNLIMANYVVDPDLLSSYVPAHTELDLWRDNCYVSLVGFMFERTRMFGVPVPGHQSFEEINLRFYVRHQHQGEWRRGTVFIREFVPVPMVTFVANRWYGEHYRTLQMSHEYSESDNALNIAYRCKTRDHWHGLSMVADMESQPIPAGSEEEFITEHYWGYTRLSDSQTGEYEVKHPRWHCHRVIDYRLDIDFGELYGGQFEILNNREPASVLLANGSAVSVESRRLIGSR